ncbi:MBL fold metallo-hydrolase [Lactovum miscens]|uniref:Glyoxylase-like metal-dependent hydrolase (Beta-lactamase superfamily II) n=1 Tax=Lactovum miscens TaxID=190387 RepID=A0A841CAN4_9LACT|nr:MBL fold metallo-hydrolase [Lactovum miscens]MBB5888778.1 glyoxylase-like metal-dependent hydrolase (beta-lactamase superfamily II) [Lactovum miscens]
MRITENVEMLEVTMPNGSIYHPTLTWDDQHLVLFDTGVPGAGDFLVEAIKGAGFNITDLTDIVITHQDIDHMGGTLELLKHVPDATVYAHKIDAPYIEGIEKPTKMVARESLIDAGEIEESDSFYQMLKRGFAQAYVPIDVKLSNGDLLNFAGGIVTVFTPGHTPGHTSFFLKESKLMICGDAANILGDQLIGSDPAMTWDNKLADESLEVIKSFNLSGAITYHTGFLKID